MLKKLIFIIVLLILGFLLWLSIDFKIVAFGIAILLFGMILLEDGFRAFTKGPLQEILKKSTNKLYKSFGVGMFVTSLIQSSSLISVITISFISAELISLYAGIGIIFGANIGSTATAWLIAAFGLKIKISALAMPMLIFGAVFSFQRNDNLKGFGNVLAGLGFFFLGVNFMKEGFDTFKDTFNLANYEISGFLGLLVYTFLGIIITTILQSSAATMVLILAALATNQISYEMSLALAIGANVGTTITAVLGALGANIAGKRLAGAHVIFNFTTGIVAIIFIHQLAFLVDFISENIGIKSTNYTIKLALFHTIFNVIGVIIMLPLIKQLEKFLHVIFKDKLISDIDMPKYLNKAVLEYPMSALEAILNETKYLFKNATFEIIAHGLNLHRDDIKSDEKFTVILKNSHANMHVDIDKLYYQKVKTIYSKIIKYTTLIQVTFKSSPTIIDNLTKVKIANRKIVEIIKSTKDLQKNVSLYMNSDNEHIKTEYEKLRRKVSKVLRETYLLRKDKNPEIHLKNLSLLRKGAEEHTVFTSKHIDNLIREKLISSNMASSLINDSDIVARMIENLIEVAELLYGTKDTLFESLDVLVGDYTSKKTNQVSD
ncbi:MAG: Na/Pi cotransporter family protein [Bacteroidales bacterium]|nr:Na/Pi cotransporter family protein [Bacteroidales bacterium]MBN2756414.1 Na/Pi cotransporter family protein [Bacteroidales bacterium]